MEAAVDAVMDADAPVAAAAAAAGVGAWDAFSCPASLRTAAEALHPLLAPATAPLLDAARAAAAAVVARAQASGAFALPLQKNAQAPKHENSRRR